MIAIRLAVAALLLSLAAATLAATAKTNSGTALATSPAAETMDPTATATGPSAAPARPIEFNDRAEERRFRALTEQLRCVMCQNQSLADSNAMIAQDLRREILQLMRAGRSDAQIKQFLVERYTGFVLYQPELQPSTWLLWFGPGLLLLGGAIAIMVIVARQKDRAALAPGDKEQEW